MQQPGGFVKGGGYSPLFNRNRPDCREREVKMDPLDELAHLSAEIRRLEDRAEVLRAELLRPGATTVELA